MPRAHASVLDAIGNTPIVELRVHGNHSTPSEDILSLSGLAVGQPATAEALESARAKVEASGRFASVDVRRLERSLDVPDDIMVMVLVEERAGVSPEHLTPDWIARVASNRMWVPVVRYDEGYGLTYGLHTALDGAFGGTSQLALPATWARKVLATSHVAIISAAMAGPMKRLA